MDLRDLVKLVTKMGAVVPDDVVCNAKAYPSEDGKCVVITFYLDIDPAEVIAQYEQSNVYDNIDDIIGDDFPAAIVHEVDSIIANMRSSST